MPRGRCKDGPRTPQWPEPGTIGLVQTRHTDRSPTRLPPPYCLRLMKNVERDDDVSMSGVESKSLRASLAWPVRRFQRPIFSLWRAQKRRGVRYKTLETPTSPSLRSSSHSTRQFLQTDIALAVDHIDDPVASPRPRRLFAILPFSATDRYRQRADVEPHGDASSLSRAGRRDRSPMRESSASR